MPARHTIAKVEWGDGDVPISTTFGDSYYARSDGLAESRHVFQGGNRLAERFPTAETFHIGELGFGTGLNFCAAVDLWKSLALPDAKFHLTSFEAAPMAPDDLARALSRWPEIAGTAGCLIDALRLDAAKAATSGARPASCNIDVPGGTLTLILGDARQTLAHWDGCVDAWFLDGFAPARNPEMWGEDLLREVFAHTRPGGTFATYSAAGHVRRTLDKVGFEVRRLPGFGTKREMLSGQRP